MARATIRENGCELTERCRRAGLRITPQRKAIFALLHCSTDHPSAEQLWKIVRKQFPHISLDTVNRALLTFAELGLVEIIESYRHSRRYDPNLQPHHHFHCMGCGRIVDFRHEAFDRIRVPKAMSGGCRIVSKRVVLSGYCPKCRAAEHKPDHIRDRSHL